MIHTKEKQMCLYRAGETEELPNLRNAKKCSSVLLEVLGTMKEKEMLKYY